MISQLLRVRYLVNDESKLAWANIAQRADGIFRNPRSPAIVQTAYNKIRYMFCSASMLTARMYASELLLFVSIFESCIPSCTNIFYQQGLG